MMKSFLIFTISFALSTFGFAADEIVNVEKLPLSVQAKAAVEEQIPLNIDVVKKTSDATPASNRILLTGVIISAMLGAAYYFVRKYKTSNTINKSNMQIKVLSQHYLGPKKSLAIIHVAGESMLVGITDSSISMIKSLSLIDDEVPANVPKTFSEALTGPNDKVAFAIAKNSAGASAKNNSGLMDENELEEEFSFSGLKDTVSKKLKSMRSI